MCPRVSSRDLIVDAAQSERRRPHDAGGGGFGAGVSKGHHHFPTKKEGDAGSPH
jgi:hypothetical protein